MVLPAGGQTGGHPIGRIPLREIRLLDPGPDRGGAYPFTIPAFRGLSSLTLEHPVTFFAGGNGSGKSTLLEAIAQAVGFPPAGGAWGHLLRREPDGSDLADFLQLSWHCRTRSGFFLRAETFFHFADFVDELAVEDPKILAAYGGRSLHARSHGESFLALAEGRFRRSGLYLLDEPEAALSPLGQLAFLRILWEASRRADTQFLIATHSPFLLACPGADIRDFDYHPLAPVVWEETAACRLARDFLADPGAFLHHLLGDGSPAEP